MKRWKKCERCSLCHNRQTVVLWRGTLPCQVLFIGEAPGDSEDVLGLPFYGPAGSILDEMIAEADPRPALERCFGPIPYAVTNIVACIPKDDYDEINRAPNKVEAAACKRRLIEFVDIANPSVIVTLGSVAQRYLPRFRHIRQFNLVHPAAILRSERRQSVLKKQFIMRLRKILQGLK